MKKPNKMIALILSSFLLLSMASCGNEGATSEKSAESKEASTGDKTIAVVAKGESHAFWQSVKAGAEDAGEKYGYKITFRGPASESAKDLPSQKEMVQSALSNNAAALVLATIGEGFSDQLTQAYEKKIPVVQFDSGIWEADVAAIDAAKSNPIISSVATSNEAAAALAAEQLFANIKEEIAAADQYTVGVIQHDETQTGIDRSKGFIDKFNELSEADETTKGKVKIATEIKPGDADNAYKAALEAVFEKGANAIFMTNEGVVKQVYDAIGAAGSKYDAIKFCGYDAGSKQIEWMKSTTGPRLVGSVAQDSYQIGFQSVEQAVFALEGKTVEPTVFIGGAWWDATNVDEMISKNLVYEG